MKIALLASTALELSREQGELRSFITSLRHGKGASKRADLFPGLADLTERLQRQWGVQCQLVLQSYTIEAPLPMEHDLHQLTREAVANAVRHGNATSIELSVAVDKEGIHLTVKDDGSGFKVKHGPEKGLPVSEKPGPWSLSERVKSLGGSLGVFSSDQGSRVMITLPLDGAK